MRPSLSLSVFVLSCTLAAFGQASMIPNYTSYTNVTAVSDGTAHVTQTISGYTQCSPTCPSGQHQPHIAYKVTNVNTGAIEQNSTVSLGSYAPGANLNVSWTVNIPPNDPCFVEGDQCRVDFVGNIYCTVIGANLFNGFATGFISIAHTKEKTTFDNGRGLCQSVAICANTTTPRCFINPVNDFGDPCHPAHNCLSLAWRYNTSAPYQCFLNACPGTEDITPGFCTPK